MNTRTTIALLLALLAAMPAAAQYDNVKDRGFNADTAYHVGEFDAVNTMNGNLTLTVPLGPVYRTNGPLEYSFKAVYNSQFWDHWQHSPGQLSTDRYRVAMSTGAYLHSWTQMMVMYHEFDWDDGVTVTDSSGVESYPSALANAGLGWMVSLGELEGGWTYVSPDGNRHQFFKYAHSPGATDGSPTAMSGPFYTRDGSFLRMSKIPNHPSDTQRRIVEFPNGIQKRFTCRQVDGQNDCNNWEDSEWFLDQIADPVGNVVWIERPLKPGPGQTWTWTVREGSTAAGNGHGDHATGTVTETRSHTLNFMVERVPANCSGNGCSGWTRLRLTSIAVAAVGGNAANYDFTYEATDIYRDHGSFWNLTLPEGMRVPFNANRKVDVQLLKAIELPQVSGPNRNARSGSWSFQYERQFACASSQPCDLITRTLQDGFTYQTSMRDGYLNQVKLPTGAVVDYEYEMREIPGAQRCEGLGPYPVAAATRAVKKKTIVEKDFDTTPAVWHYLSYYDPVVEQFGSTCRLPNEFAAAVQDPKNVLSVTYYSVFRHGDPENQPWVREEYGLPMTKAVPDPAGGGRFLSSEIYQCGGAAGPRDLKNVLSHHSGSAKVCGQPLRREYLRYEYGSVECPTTSQDGLDCVFSNPRVASHSLVHLDSPSGNRLTTDYEDYDGFGHYRRTITSGNVFEATFNGGGDMRVSHRDYNSGVTYTRDSVSSFPQNYPSVWLLNRYESDTTQEMPNGTSWDRAHPPVGLKTRKTETFFNRSTGLLERTRIFASDNGQRRGNDLVTVVTREAMAAGRIRLTERHYGGDDASLATGPLETLAFTDPPDYELETRLAWGTVQWRGYLDCETGAVALTLEDNLVDAATGLVTLAKDSSNAPTSLEYDRLGRITRVSPPGQEPLGYTYEQRGDGAEANWARVILRRRTQTPQGMTLLDQTIWRYDHLGRLAAVLKWLAGPSPGDNSGAAEHQTYQRTTYDSLGRKARVWAPVKATDAKQAGYVAYAYDAFGRQTAVSEYLVGTSSDVLERTTTKVYHGAWKVTETIGSQSPRTTHFDRHGRPIRVDEYSGTEGGLRGVRYQYDITNQLSGVYNATDRNMVAAPRISFERDGRGLLLRENLAELTNLGNGIRYSGFDARGHYTKRELAQDGGIAPLLFRYDRAERLVEVSNAAGVLKEFLYHKDGGAAGDGYKRGKLASVTRWNLAYQPGAILTPCVYKVTESYEYDGSSNTDLVQGKLRRVTLNGSPVLTPGHATDTPCAIAAFGATTEYAYDRWGNVSNMQYPAGGPSIAYTHRRGDLQTVSDWVSSIRYDASGGIARMARTNWTRDAITYQENGLGRPDTIRLEKINRTTNTAANTLWKHGPISYDGAGNVTAIGGLDGASETYTYDPIGRLKTANVGGATETYLYDRWGNLFELHTTIPGQPAISRSNSIDIATNRSAAYSYDHAGNVREMPDLRPGAAGAKLELEYDPFNMAKRLRSHPSADGKGLARIYLYDANDERVAVIDPFAQGATERWTVRGLGHQVLAELERTGSGPATLRRTYVYGAGRLLGEYDASGNQRHYHLDHLGSVRQITDAPAPNRDGTVVGQHRYLPFGYEVPLPTSLTPGFRFAGHERDDDGTADRTADLDYMHARYYRAHDGRFLSLDPIGGNPARPQSWNRYAYASNNPVKLVDPDGMSARDGNYPRIDHSTGQLYENGEWVEHNMIQYEVGTEAVTQTTSMATVPHLGNDVVVNGEVMASVFSEVTVTASSVQSGDAQANPPADPIPFLSHVIVGLVQGAGHGFFGTAFTNATGRPAAGKVQKIGASSSGAPNMKWVDKTGKTSVRFISVSDFNTMRGMDFLYRAIFEGFKGSLTQDVEGKLHGSH